MAKSIRSKVKKRLRTAKRQRVDAMIVRPREEAHFASLTKQMAGQGITLSTPKNAFRHPNAKDAFFPQHEIGKPLDFRSENLPMAGYTYRGNRRKYEPEEQKYMEDLSKNHPKMEVLAGGGAVVAATGEFVSKLQAEEIATQVQKPEEFGKVAAAAAAQPSAASAVEAAVAADASMDSNAAASKAEEPEVVPTNKADTSRRPIVKDVNRVKRVAENQTKVTKTSRKSKVNPAAPVMIIGESAKVKKATKAKSPKKGASAMAVDE